MVPVAPAPDGTTVANEQALVVSIREATGEAVSCGRE